MRNTFDGSPSPTWYKTNSSAGLSRSCTFVPIPVRFWNMILFLDISLSVGPLLAWASITLLLGKLHIFFSFCFLCFGCSIPIHFSYIKFPPNLWHATPPSCPPWSLKSSFKLPTFMPEEGSYSPVGGTEGKLWIQTNLSLKPGCVPLEKLPNLSDSHFFQLENWYQKCLLGIWWVLSDIWTYSINANSTF